MSFLKNWMRKGSSETPMAKRKREHEEGLAKQKERDQQEKQRREMKAVLKERWKDVLDPSHRIKNQQQLATSWRCLNCSVTTMLT